MQIKVLLFASLRELTDMSEIEIKISQNSSISSLLNKLKEKFPLVQEFSQPLLFAINNTYCKEEEIIKENDIVAIFPPVSGG